MNIQRIVVHTSSINTNIQYDFIPLTGDIRVSGEQGNNSDMCTSKTEALHYKKYFIYNMAEFVLRCVSVEASVQSYGILWNIMESIRF